MEAGWRPDSSNLGASLAEICACSCLAFVGGRPSCQFFNLSSLASPRAKPGILRSQPCSDSRKINRRLTLRKPERRKSQRLLCQWNPGRDSDALIEDRRSEGDLAHIYAALQERAGKPARDRKATWRRPYPGRKRAEERRRRARQRAADQSSQ